MVRRLIARRGRAPWRVLWALLAAVALPAVAPALAQTTDSTLTARFQLADAYVRAGQFDRAIPLLEDLHAASPATYLFFERLKEAYENLKRFDEAVALVEARLRTSGPLPDLLADRARLLFLKGDDVGAFQAWDDALAAHPDDRNTYRAVYQSQYEVRLIDRAIATLERAVARLGPAALFQTDLAYLYTLSGQYEMAMDQYLDLLAVDPRQVNFVRTRLARLIEQEGALPAVVGITERAVRKTPLSRPYRELLAWLYIEAGDYRKALDTSRAIDRLERENGRVLFTFAQTAADAGAFDVALEAYEEVLARYPDAPAVSDARLGLGAMHEQWARRIGERPFDASGARVAAPHAERALELYRAFVADYPASPYRAEVLRRIGHLQREVFFDLDAAEATLAEIVRRYPDNPTVADGAAFDLGRIALLRGRPDEARLAFSRLIDRLRTGELAGRARYELALLHFYAGEFTAARALAEVLNENTSTDVANDAIELKLLLLENGGPDSTDAALRLFARAHLLERRRLHADALATLDSLQQAFPDHPLADDTFYLRAEALRATGRAREALAVYEEIPLRFPQSYLADRSLFAAADLQEHDLADPDAALATYTRLLTTFPGSLLATEARTRIRAIRGDSL